MLLRRKLKTSAFIHCAFYMGRQCDSSEDNGSLTAWHGRASMAHPSKQQLAIWMNNSETV